VCLGYRIIQQQRGKKGSLYSFYLNIPRNVITWDEKNPGASRTPYIDSLNKPKKRVGRDKGLTELMGGSFK